MEDNKKVIILNLGDGDFFSLEDQVSIIIWELLVEGKSVGEILEKLAQTFSGVEEKRLEADLDAFLERLLEKKIICKSA